MSTDYAVDGREVAAGWLTETLALAVPQKMAELHADARKVEARTGTPWRDVLRHRLAAPRAPQQPAFARPEWRTTADPVTVATRGDTLTMAGHGHPGYTPGKTAEVFVSLMTGLATAALVNPSGVTYRGHHWCRTHACPACPRSTAQRLRDTQDEALAADTDWWAPLAALLAEEGAA